MTHIMQILIHMLKTLEYSVDETIEIFTDLAEGTTDIYEVLDSLGVEPTDHQIERIEKALPNWKSALVVTGMRLNIEVPVAGPYS